MLSTSNKYQSEKMPLPAYCQDLGNNNLDRPQVPIVIRAALSELDRRAACDLPNIWKTPGNKIKVIALSDAVLNKDITFDKARREVVKFRQVSTITSFVREFFAKHLVEPLLTFDGINCMAKVVWDDKCATDSDLHKVYSLRTIEKLQDVIKQLPSSSIDTLSMLFLHFKQVVHNSDRNFMNSTVLANSLSADIIGYRVCKPTAKDIKVAPQFQTKLFKALLQVPAEFYEQYYMIQDIVEKSSGSNLLSKAKTMLKLR